MNCLEATRTLSEEQERALEPGEQVALRLHLALCSPCRDFRQQVAFLRESMQAYGRRPDDSTDEDRDASQ